MRAAADQRDARSGVVRRPVRAPSPVAGVERLARDRAHRAGFDGLGVGHWRQDAGQARGQHGFASAGRADHQQVMAAGRGDFQRAPRMQLAAHVGEVGDVVDRFLCSGRGGRGQQIHATQVRADFGQRARDTHFHIAQQRGFLRIASGNDHAALAATCAQQCR